MSSTARAFCRPIQSTRWRGIKSARSAFRKIEEAVRRFREGRPGDQALEQLLGLQMTDEQHRLGRGLCDTVAEQTAEAILSRMWGSADSLPSMPELEEPTLWLARTA